MTTTMTMQTNARCAAITARGGARGSAFVSGARRSQLKEAASGGCTRRGAAAGARSRRRAREDSGVVTVVADVKKAWKSSRSMTLTIRDEDEAHSFATYISDGERIVNVTFPDEKRREKLDDTTWKVQLLPFQFLQWRATVVCTLKLENCADGLHLTTEDLDIQGLPDEFGVNGRVWLTMDGALKPARTSTKAGRKVLGKLTVNLSAEINDMVAMVPGLDDAVNLINDTVIANLQGAINASIASDYTKWKVVQQKALV